MDFMGPELDFMGSLVYGVWALAKLKEAAVLQFTGNTLAAEGSPQG